MRYKITLLFCLICLAIFGLTSSVLANPSEDFIIKDNVLEKYIGNDRGIIIPEGVKEIKAKAFENSSDIVYVVIPESVKTINVNAFNNGVSFQGFYTITNEDVDITIYGYPGSVAEFFVDNSLYGGVHFVDISKIDLSTIEDYRYVTHYYAASDNGVIGVIGIQKYMGTDSEILIPNNVQFIETEAFADCSFITDVIIPEGVKEIKNKAFLNCINLKQITLPTSVTNIAANDYSSYGGDMYLYTNDAFKGCNNFTIYGYSNTAAEDYYLEFNSSKNITFVDKFTFSEYNNDFEFTYKRENKEIKITKYIGLSGNVIIPSHIMEIPVTQLEDNIFSNRQDITSVTISNNITSIKNKEFLGCTNLEKVKLPDTLKSIGDKAFLGCYSLKEIYIPDSVESIGESAFEKCTNLEKVHLPEKLSQLKDYLFFECSSLESITIPSSVYQIGYDVFKNCKSLSKVTFDRKSRPISNLNNNIFYGCPNLTLYGYSLCDDLLGKYANRYGINFVNLLPPDISDNKDFYFEISEDGTIKIISCYLTNQKEIIIPLGVNEIGSSVFANNEATAIIIPDTVTTIDDNAFQYCTNLEKIDIPDSVIYIGDNAFLGCSSLESITVPCNVEYLGVSAFKNCKALISADLSHVKNTICIKEDLFNGCMNLTYLKVIDEITSIETLGIDNINNITVEMSTQL